jgi:hypothetical protein
MERKTKMMTMLFLTLTLMTLTLVSVPAVSAKTLKFNLTIYLPGLNPNMHGIQPQDRSADWSGPLTGDIVGTAYFWETDKNFVTGAKGGKVEHYFEDFLFVFDDADGGGWIVGWINLTSCPNGIFTFANKAPLAKFRSEGRVTEASEGRQSFIGCKTFEEGIVDMSDPNTWIGEGRGYIKAP